MKWLLYIVCFLAFSTTAAVAQDEAVEEIPAEMKQQLARVEAQFESIVENFAAFFETKQKLLYAHKLKKAKQGYAAYVIEYTCKEVHYVVNSTGDERLPFLASITLSLSKKTNRSCGDTKGATMLGLPAGWSSAEKAVESAHKTSCYKSNLQATGNQVRINFEYIEGKWHYKNTLNETRKEAEYPLSAVFGKPEGPALSLEEPVVQTLNSKWAALLIPR